MTITETVEPSLWRETLAAAVQAGYDFPGFFAATDRGETIELVARLFASDWQIRTFVTAIPAVRPLIDSVVDVVPGFAWNEREIAEMLGVTFEGGDGRPLLRRDISGPPPLLRTTPLTDRLTTPWPGAAEPGLSEGDEGMQRRSGNPSRRRQRPPGIPDSWASAS